ESGALARVASLVKKRIPIRRRSCVRSPSLFIVYHHRAARAQAPTMTHQATRRDFIREGATLAALAALPNCSKSKASPAPSPSPVASGMPCVIGDPNKPETPDLRFGMIALTDCSPIVIAHEKGLFKKYGINSTITKGANWSAIRENISSGSLQATHMLIAMPLASTMGLLGSRKKPMVIPWLLNRNGQ